MPANPSASSQNLAHQRKFLPKPSNSTQHARAPVESWMRAWRGEVHTGHLKWWGVRGRRRIVLVEVALEAAGPLGVGSWGGEAGEELGDGARRCRPVHLPQRVHQIFSRHRAPVHRRRRRRRRRSCLRPRRRLWGGDAQTLARRRRRF